MLLEKKEERKNRNNYRSINLILIFLKTKILQAQKIPNWKSILCVCEAISEDSLKIAMKIVLRITKSKSLIFY